MRFYLAIMLLASTPALAQPQQRHHPPADMPLHEKFYSTWYMPDNRRSRAATRRIATRQK